MSQAVGNHHFSQWSKANRSKTLLDRVTPSDIAYTILVYENSKEVWEEELQIKSRTNDANERRQATRLKNPSIMKGGVSVSEGMVMAGQIVDESITKSWYIHLKP